ncbi:hypothetical protein SGQ83_10230 [Flavobacterium sp. Fl-318]|uniref:Cation/H+ exchanger domain-containing protein n=1 Tax=Flavobacterium cupriresistens TaxID=2893885 RepID=A0ABU4RDH7_9FLAO|nr:MULTISPECIES: hypothetical protein [unclassified Flavobacterium]MDX6189729.1 hypothetical protein [Flavobacterium sp. Fl-318]UFH40865.1 hypothetical protein LNP23_13725 [Flavobacterium sp. F-323]
MENYSIIIFILAIVIGLSAFADKIKLPYPILLVIVGIIIGFFPSMGEIEINPSSSKCSFNIAIAVRSLLASQTLLYSATTFLAHWSRYEVGRLRTTENLYIMDKTAIINSQPSIAS